MKIKFYDDLNKLKDKINDAIQKKRILTTQLMSMSDEKRKFDNCVELLKKNLRDELISVTQGQIEVFWDFDPQVPIILALKRKVKNLQEKISEIDVSLQRNQTGQENQLESLRVESETLQRKLRNFILNIEYRQTVSREGPVKYR